VSGLLQAKADVKASDQHGTTALINIAQFNMHFVETGRIPEESLPRIVKELVAAGASVEAKRKYDGATPLIEAARQGDLPVVKALLEAGANVSARDNDGKTALQQPKAKPEIVAALKEAAAAAAKPGVKR
jgi:ankyrin repeat protein